jgi:multiple sugar transport system ATP-binding protein
MAGGSGAAIMLERVRKYYDRVRAVEDLSFEVAENRFFVLFGPSAVGKTTTLRMIAGLVRPDTGSLSLFGRNMTHAPIAGRGVSMVFQSFALYPHLTVYQNLAYPLVEEKVGREEIDKRVKETAATLKLSHRLERKPNTLSGGEQQRVALGRALIRRPRILLLDEPLTNLDAKLRHDMRAELKRLHRQFDMTVVYATPDELEALSMGEEIAVMRDGGIVQRGTPDELYEKPIDSYVASKIGSPQMNMLPATIGADGRSLVSAIGILPPPAVMASVQAGEPTVVGIRPADIRLAREGDPAIDARVQLIEPLGDITLVSVDAQGETLRLVMPEATAVALREGVPASIYLNPSKFHVFRASTGQALT